MHLFSYYHKEFFVNQESDWHFPVRAINQEPKFDKPKLPNGIETSGFENILNLSSYSDRIHRVLGNYSKDVLLNHIEGQIIFEWILQRNFFSLPKILGFSTYRRILLPMGGAKHEAFNVEASQKNFNALTANEIGFKLNKYLETRDCLLAKRTPVRRTLGRQLDVSVEDQYLAVQDPHYWNLFLRAIDECLPKYSGVARVYFKSTVSFSYESPIICHRDLMLQLAEEFITIMQYIWRESRVPIPTEASGNEPKPWRYCGFIGERFFPFFFSANKCKTFELPLVRFL